MTSIPLNVPNEPFRPMSTSPAPVATTRSTPEVPLSRQVS